MGGGGNWVGQRFADSGETARLPGYVVWNAMLSWKLSRNVALQLNGLNLLNRYYFAAPYYTSVAGKPRHTRRRSQCHAGHQRDALTLMLVAIPGVLTAQELQTVRAHLSGASWGDGRVTAGYRSAQVKANLQVPQEDPVAREARDIILSALERNATFISAALPHRVFPPLFNRYQPGMAFGDHIDNAVRQIPGTPHRLRTDIAATLFLSDPEDYGGG